MKTPIIILGILVSILTIFTACEDSKTETSDFKAEVSQQQDQKLHAGIINHTDGETVDSDPFVINGFEIKDASLYITVSYSGGCQKHAFNLVWPEAIIMIYPPQFDLVLTHDANGDMCEAYPTETLVFDLTGNPLGIPASDFSNMKMVVVNGSKPDERIDLVNPECAEVICTKIFKTLEITVKDLEGHPVALDRFNVIDLENGQDFTSNFDEEGLAYMQQHGVYPLFSDDHVYGNQNRKFDINFIGYKEGLEIVNQKYTVSIDCCHVSLFNGETEIYGVSEIIVE